MKKLNEAIQVTDADFIGSANGYDVFDIKSFDAAQQFKVEDREDEAGTAYVHSQNTFNSNINENQHLYFFAEENTNKVYGAVVISSSTSGNITFVADNNTQRVYEGNFLFENAGSNSSKCYFDRPLPLKLIPNLTFTDLKEEYLPMIIFTNTISAVLPQFGASTHIPDLVIPDCVETLFQYCFNFGLTIDTVTVPSSLKIVPANTFSNISHINVPFAEDDLPDGWDPNWNGGKTDNVTWSYGLSEEEIARIAQEKAAKKAEEEEKIRREKEEQERQKQLAAEREARKLRYRVEGNHVTIKGTRKGVTDLEIPSEIDGKPVTKIEAYAFYDDKDLDTITIPDSVKLIEQGAFLHSGITYSIYVAPDCVIGKYNDYIRNRSRREDY